MDFGFCQRPKGPKAHNCNRMGIYRVPTNLVPPNWTTDPSIVLCGDCHDDLMEGINEILEKNQMVQTMLQYQSERADRLHRQSQNVAVSIPREDNSHVVPF